MEHIHHRAGQTCPSEQRLEAALATSSSLMEHAEYRKAVTALQPLEALDCDPRASLLLAAAYDQSGEEPEAERILKRAHTVWPDDNSIAASLAREYLRTGQTKQAATALQHFRASANTPRQEMEIGIIAFLAAHRLRSAQALARLNYKTYPSAHSLVLLANSIQMEGLYKEVIALLEGKRALYGNSAAFLITIAESESDAKMFGAASRDLQSAITKAPNLYQPHYLLGNVLLATGKARQAEAEYRIAIGLSPNQPIIYDRLALALRAQQDEAGEVKVLGRALAIDPNDSMAHAEMGRILLHQNRLPEAVAHLKAAIQSDPSSEEAYSLLARAYGMLGDMAEAKATAARLSAVRARNHRSAAAAGAAGARSGGGMKP